MKKILYTVIVLTLIFLMFNIESFAFETELNDVWENIDNETKEYLNDLGITEISYNKIFELTPTRVLEHILDTALNKGKSVTDILMKICLILIIIAAANSFLKENDKLSQVLSLLGVLIILSFIIEPVSRLLADAQTGILTSTIFVNSYLPVLTAIIAAAKKPAMAVTYNSFSFFLSSVITIFAQQIFVPMLSTLLSFNVMTCFSFESYKDRIFKTVKRIIVIILSLFSTVYTGLLTTQSILASSSDSLTLKGIRFVSGTFIPVVGAGVGDAISSVFSSFLIMKNTLGIFVILVIVLINLPVIIEILVWYFLLSLISIISSLLGLNGITDIIDSISGVLSLLNIILFFVTFVMVISTGVIIMIGK